VTRPDLVLVARAFGVAALVLAISSHGDAIVLAVALVLALPRPTTVVAVGGALLASSWRWGSTSLNALAGAQAVLGPAGWVGPRTAVASTWLAGAAVVLAMSRGTDVIRVLAVGAVAAALVAGPGPGGDLWIRFVAGAAAAAVAWGVATATDRRPRLARPVGILAAAAGLAAVAAASRDAPRWPPQVELGLVGTGALVAAAAVGIALVVQVAGRGARWSGGLTPPRLSHPGAHRRAPDSRSR
jgi:hypothetical protein